MGYLSTWLLSKESWKSLEQTTREGERRNKENREENLQHREGNPWKLHESLVRVGALLTDKFSVYSTGRTNLFCDWHQKSSSVDVPGCTWDIRMWPRWPKAKLVTQPAQTLGEARLLSWPWHTIVLYHQCLLFQTPLASFSPQCPSLWHSLTHINPFNFSFPSMVLSEHNAALQPLHSSGTKLHRTNPLCLDGIIPVSVAGNDYKNTDAIKNCSFQR